jgi:hypothetical protein
MRALIVLALLIAAPASAQVQPWRGPYPTVGEQHRWEMDRLRYQADAQAAHARQLQLESRLTVLELQAARQPALVPPPAYRALRSPSEERALRESAAVRGRSVGSTVGQIDAWLDRASQ